MKLYQKIFGTFILATAMLQNSAHAQAVKVLPGEVFVTEALTGKFTCAYIAPKWIPGKLKKDGVTFTSSESEVKKLTNKLAVTKDSNKQKTLQAKIAKLKTALKNGKAACKKGPGSVITPPIETSVPGATKTPGTVTTRPGSPTTPGTGNPTVPGGIQTPAPFGVPTRTPTPIPTLTSTNFDSAGNVTEKGKTTFAIPSSLTANIEKGRLVSNNNSCTGCHGEKTSRSYTNLAGILPAAPMYIQLSSQDLANLTAYVNRFRP